MGFGKRIAGGITLAVAGATLFTAGSSHAAVAASGRSGAAAAAQAKVITWAMSPGADPNWVFPVVPAADKLIHASITSRNPAAVKNEAAFLTRNQPVLFQPNSDYTWAWKKNITGPTASFRSLTQYFADPEFWSVTG